MRGRPFGPGNPGQPKKKRTPCFSMSQKLSNCNKEEGTPRELQRFSIIRDKLRSYRQGLQELNRIQQSTALQSTNRNPSSTSTGTTGSGSSSKY